MIDLPSCGQLQHQLLNFRFCSHVYTTSGFIQDQNLWVCCKPARQNNFLLVSAAQVFNQLIRGWCGNSQKFYIFFGNFILFLGTYEFKPSVSGLQSQDDIFANC